LPKHEVQKEDSRKKSKAIHKGGSQQALPPSRDETEKLLSVAFKSSGDRPVSTKDVISLQKSIGNQSTLQLLSNKAIRQKSLSNPSGVVQRYGGPQHESIERQGMEGAFSPEEQRDIAFGNWANDFNQINLAGDFIRNHTPLRITNQDLFDIAQIVAEEQFGATIAGRMDPQRFGVYNWQQHFDNPATDPNAPPDVGPVAAHISTSREYVRQRLRDALYANDPAIGREYFGSAMHVMEDFFAHTNFVEIALRRCGVMDIQPRPGTEDPNREQLIGGIFATSDTVVSILHLIGNQLQRPARPDQPLSSSDRILLILLRRQHPTLASAYEEYCRLDFAARRVIPGYEAVHRRIQRFKASIIALLGSAANAASRVTTAVATGGGQQPAHSRLNKDDQSQPHYQLARALSVHVVRQMTPPMQEAWRLRRAVPPGQSAQPASPPASPEMAAVQEAEQRLLAMVDQYTSHPDDSTWWQSMVRTYAAGLMARQRQ
jgi:hypothetical protein